MCENAALISGRQMRGGREVAGLLVICTTIPAAVAGNELFIASNK